MFSVLCVDEDRNCLQALCLALSGHYEVHICDTGMQALKMASLIEPAIILFNPILKNFKGSIMGLLSELCMLPFRPCLIGLSEASAPWLVDNLRDRGVAAFVSKPWDPNWLLLKLTQVHSRWYQKYSVPLKELAMCKASRYAERQVLVGSSDYMKGLRESIEVLASSNKPVLIRGETGTGKDLVARCIHERSLQRNSAFVVRNVGAIPDSLLASELFGSEKGAYTDAISRMGCIAEAANGSLFFDEIGEASQLFQTTLLRVIDSGDYQVLGSNKTEQSAFRLFCATNRPLEAMVDSGEFRMDLWHRINVLSVFVPPLRDRLEDIPELVEEWCQREAVSSDFISPEVLIWLQGQTWSGNVRELFNVLSRAWVLKGEKYKNLELKHFYNPQYTYRSTNMKKASDFAKDFEGYIYI